MPESSSHTTATKLYKWGLVVGKFLPPHKGHEYMIQTAAEKCENVLVLVVSNPDPYAFSTRDRMSLLQQIFKYHLTVYTLEGRYKDTPIHFDNIASYEAPHENDDDWTQREAIKTYFEDSEYPYPDAVFTSEEYGRGFALHMGVKHYLVDINREKFPISGTEIRENPYENLDMLPEPVKDFYTRGEYIERVVFLGAESTGKSTLAARMAEEYGTLSTTEYGREACEGDKYHAYSSEEMAEIVHAQKHMEADLINSGQCRDYLFCDTNALTTFFYSYEYNNECHPDVLYEAKRADNWNYQHVFLCDIDIPFEDDGTRRLSGQAHKLQQSMNYMILDMFNVHYTVLSGTLEERVQKVKDYLDYQKKIRFGYDVELMDEWMRSFDVVES